MKTWALKTKDFFRANLRNLGLFVSFLRLPAELRHLLRELQSLTQLRDMPRRMEVCRRALALVSRSQHAEIWAALQLELGNSLAQNPLGNRAANLEQAIQHCEQALDVYTAEAYPEQWAAIQNNLALMYKNRIRGTQADNLEQAIRYYKQALRVYTPEAYPELWATLQTNLGGAYSSRIQGMQADNLEQAIRYYEQALRVYTLEAYPEWRAATHNDLALAYSSRIRGTQADNLEQAIRYYEQALHAFTPEAYPEQWAAIQANLGGAYSSRIQGERADNLEQAIQHCELALRVYTPEAYPERWAAIQNNLANAYMERIREEQADNLEQAIRYYEQALRVYTLEAYPEQWARTQSNLTLVYSNRIQGAQAKNLEQAIQHGEQALRVYTLEAYPEQWARTQNNLALAYGDRIRGERAENLEQAIAHYGQALRIYTPEAYPEQWAMTQNNLANAYGDRIRGERAENLEQAIAHYEQALRIYTPEAYSERWAGIQNNLALVYSNRIREECADNLEQAIRHGDQALRVYTLEAYPERWATTQNNLANAYTNRIRGERTENLEQAIAHYEQALRVYTPEAYPEQRAMTLNNLAYAYNNRIHGERAVNLERATLYYEQALQVYTLAEFPAPRRRTLRNLGNLYFDEQNWAAACAAYVKAMAAGDTLLAAAYTEGGRQAEVGETAQVYAHAAYCLLHLGQPGAALLRLEHGKTRLLAETLALGDADLTLLPDVQRQAMQNARDAVRALEADMRLSANTPAHRSERAVAADLRQARADLTRIIETIRAERPDFMPTGLDLAGLLGVIPARGALVAPFFTPQGSAVFVLPWGTQTVTEEQVIWLPGFTTTRLYEMLQGPADVRDRRGWLETYFKYRGNLDNSTFTNAWFETIERTGQVLWDTLMEPVHTRLQILGLGEGAPVLLMPQGGLGLLPLHAAWREGEEGRRAFLDDYTVSYAPSGYALSVSQRRLQEARRQVRSLLAVVNPTTDLPFTPVEGETAAALFAPEARQMLAESRATPEAVIQATPGRGYLHFSCHGFYDWQDALRSGLLLADRVPLTLAQIIGELDLSVARLVTLSACETGLTDIRYSPDEFIGLSAGFLQAGTPAVVSTLWIVDDLSTALLMERFYHSHLQDNLPPAAALRQAQRWLRNLTANDLRRRFAAERKTILTTRMPAGVVTEQFNRFAELDPHTRPFAHPFYWAAFTFSGV